MSTFLLNCLSFSQKLNYFFSFYSKTQFIIKKPGKNRALFINLPSMGEIKGTALLHAPNSLERRNTS